MVPRYVYKYVCRTCLDFFINSSGLTSFLFIACAQPNDPMGYRIFVNRQSM